MAEAGGMVRTQAFCCLQGDVLEVSAGTGRNLRYYSKAASSVTLTDTSKHMLWHARQKLDKDHINVPVTFCLVDAQRMLSNNAIDDKVPRDASLHSAKVQQPDSMYQDQLQTFSPAQFDTVIDTFGLCSHADPVAALKVGWLTLTMQYLSAVSSQSVIQDSGLHLEGGALHHTRAFASRLHGLLSAQHLPG